MARHSIGRREFLMAAGTSRLGLRNWSAGRRPTPPGANDRVNLAVIGRRGYENFGEAAQVAGFQIVAARGLDVDEILADRSIDAVCIAAPAAMQAELTVRACQAGKDVYVDTPVFAKLDEGPAMVEAARRYHRVVQAGTVLRSGPAMQRARELVRRGELGEVAFCRVTGGRNPMPLIDLVQFLFDEAALLSLDAQGGAETVNLTLRYPGLVVSYESAAEPWGLWIHGTRATLALHRAVAPQLAHWKDFLECIRTRRRPVGDIETCVGSTTACLRVGLAMRHNWSVV